MGVEKAEDRDQDDPIPAVLTRLLRGERVDLDAALSSIKDPQALLLAKVEILVAYNAYLDETGHILELEQTLDDHPPELVAMVREGISNAQLAAEWLPRSLEIGDRLGERYHLTEELGRGGMGVVYAAHDETLDRSVAVKVFNDRRAPVAGAQWQDLVRRESQILASLSSRNIVAVHDACRDGHHSYLVMDRIRGVDLHTVIQTIIEEGSGASEACLTRIVGKDPDGEYERLLDGQPWPRVVAGILARAARGLERAHAAGVVHRDLKPQNVMIVPGGEPVLLDFGFSTGLDRGTPSHDEGFPATLAYIAPEQARSYRSGNDPRTDIYQLGLVLYELASLRPAFHVDEHEDIGTYLSRRSTQSVEFPPSTQAALPPVLREICKHALEPEASERYGSAAELREDLERFLDDRPPLHAKVGAMTRAGMWARYLGRRPAGFASIAFVVLGIMLWMLLRPAWQPPLLVPFVWREGGGERLEQGSLIRTSGHFALGVDVAVSTPTLLFVLQLEGSELDPSSCAAIPFVPEHLGRLDVSSEETGPLLLQPGTHRVVCSYVKGDPSAAEGFVAFAVPDGAPQARVLQEWFRGLQAEWARSEGLFPVRYQDALLQGVVMTEGSKGVSATQMTTEDRRRLFAVATRGGAPLGRWIGADFLRQEFLFAVIPDSERH